VGDDALLLRRDQLLQVSKQRPDGWAFGSVVYDEIDRPPLGVDGLSTQAGWFPLARTAVATPDQLAKLNEKMGGSAADALAPPLTWTKLKDPMVAEMVWLDERQPRSEAERTERAQVIDYFKSRLHGRVHIKRIVSVQRVQNVAMWQSYAVKKQTIMAREEKATVDKLATDANANLESEIERKWLFHGTDEGTVPKIAQQGFNRMFCGKNATAYGKGVYFARDSSYSASTTYSRPNDKREQHMFLCRVVVGVYCKGMRDVLTPDVRPGHHHMLYDSTVDNVANPSLFVTFHDAQAYPEYLIKFEQ